MILTSNWLLELPLNLLLFLFDFAVVLCLLGALWGMAGVRFRQRAAQGGLTAL
jgi:hypothetical protein